MNEETPPWYVLTGGPCAGKTTTIHEIARRGYPVLAEPARLIIDEKLAAGETIHQIVTDPHWLPSVVERAYAMEKEVPLEDAYFFDRAIPDSLAYYDLHKLAVDDFLKQAMSEIRYRKVFLLDLVDFTNDSGRPETPEEAQTLHQLIRDAYESVAYKPIIVPVMTVEDRVDFILSHI